MGIAVATVEYLYSTILRPDGPDAIFLLGAGASVKSGIPLSGEMVERAAKWAYCRSVGRLTNDPTVVRSDWLPWLHSHSWYRIDQGPAGNYSEVIENLLQPREDRKDFFIRILNPSVPPSSGYQHLVDLMADAILRTVLTTNFDDVLPDLCRGNQRPHHVEVIKTPADFTKFSTSPRYPQVVYLHGSVEHYTDQNLIQETQRLNQALVAHLVPLLRDHPLVVVGYRGAEPSVLRHLLMEQAEATNYYRHGVFWCTMPGSNPNDLHPIVIELADLIGGNFQVVPIEGFDELAAQVWLQSQQSIKTLKVTPKSLPSQIFQPPTDDMTPIDGVTLDELDWIRVQAQVIEYCRRMALSVPSPVQREWLIARLCDMDLAVNVAGTIQITTGGLLLFGRRPHEELPSARVVLHSIGEAEELIEGNLWVILDAITKVLEEDNRPFRLKGTVSEVVYPYPPLALKELVVNALVHRSYVGTNQTVIEIEPAYIRITNPGGLVEEVFQRVVATPLQDQIERGARGIKGYRNPVIADVFYGAGAMDKAGSGLADVQSWVRSNGGKVIFGPSSDNTEFEVTIYRRPESVDQVTGTAVPLVTTARFTSNMFEIVDLPQTVWHAGITASTVRDVWQAAGGQPLPPFILPKGSHRIFTFSDLSCLANPFRSQIDAGELEELSVSEFSYGEDGERLLVQLLNECLYRHLQTRSLIVDKGRKRAYFPRTSEGPREVAYQARIRRATRTVTKPIISKYTQRVRYWEHESVRFQFERHGDKWVLQILPGYTFTVDGRFTRLEGPRVGPLSTRRAARDYNAQVHNDLVFWSWIFSDGQDSFAIDTGSSVGISARGSLVNCEVHDLPQSSLPDETELDGDAQTEMDQIEEELAELAEETIAEGEGTTDEPND